MTVDDLIVRLIEREGGYVNHPHDKGGPTNHGITQAALAAWRETPVTDSDVRGMSRSEALLIYRDRYFVKPGLDAVQDPELQELLFDFAVNSGPSAAVKALQTALQGMGLYTGDIDGGLGPMTRQGLRACPDQRTGELYWRVKCERYELFLRFIGRDHRQAVFATGWSNRMDELQRP